jgi:hypothetical protein
MAEPHLATDQPPAASRRRGLRVMSVVTAALLLAGVVAAVVGEIEPRPSPQAADRAAAAAFLATWRTHLLASWSADQDETRTTASVRGGLSFAVHEAQRPPNSVTTGDGTVSARRGSDLIACATPPDATAPVCRVVPTDESWAQDAAQQIAAIGALLLGPTAQYDISRSPGGCFAFQLMTPSPTASTFLGDGARYCVDPVTGVLLSSQVERGAVIDTLVTVAYHAPASDADLALPPDAVYSAG